MAGIWQAATIISNAPGGRVEVDALGEDSIRFLSESFRKNDGVDFGNVGVGIDVIEAEP